jgi:hypothetical protein
MIHNQTEGFTPKYSDKVIESILGKKRKDIAVVEVLSGLCFPVVHPSECKMCGQVRNSSLPIKLSSIKSMNSHQNDSTREQSVQSDAKRFHLI